VNEQRKRVIIVGAGPAGLTAAAELIGTRYSVLLLEQDERYVGGISRTVEYGGYRFDIGGHRFFSQNPEITKWWRERLPLDFLSVKRQSRIFYRNKFYDYPLRPANALGNLGVFTSLSCLLSYLSSQIAPIKPEKTFEDWVSNRFGRKMFRIFFKTYTEKVWGMPCSSISADWASQRIKGLSLKAAIFGSTFGQRGQGAVIKTLIDRFEYPRLGPGMMWEKTRDDLLGAGVDIKMGKRVVGISHEGGCVRSVRTVDPRGRTEDWHGDDFIFSMPLSECVLNMSPSLDKGVEAAAAALKYRDFICVVLIVAGDDLFGDNWIYIHDPGVRLGRIQNFNNWSQEMVPRKDVTCLGLEYFCAVGDTLWKSSDDDLAQLAKFELQKIGLIPGLTVVDSRVVRMEKAYPVYDADYQNNVSTIRSALSGLSNLQMIGRNGMHKYNNQDHSMMTGIVAARNLTGSKLDPWLVNTDASYQEADIPSGLPKTERLVPRPL
jgi:protoporphyrinogen oxidase